MFHYQKYIGHLCHKETIKKSPPELNDSINPMDLTDFYTAFHPTNGTVSKVGYVLEHKSNLNKYRKFEMIPLILYDLNGIKIDSNNKRNDKKYPMTESL